MTPAEAGTAAVVGSTRLGGLPDVPPGFEWPVWRDGDELAFVGQIALDEIARRSAVRTRTARAAADTGLLLVFFDLDMRPARAPAGRPRRLPRRARRRRLCRRAAAGRVAALAERPVQLSVELTLPSESAGLPRELALDPHDLDAWQRLREALAELQGVEVEDRAFDWHALHRLGGWPDASEEGMEADCELVTHGIDLNAGERYFDPRVPSSRPARTSWRLLLQVSSDDDLGTSLGYPSAASTSGSARTTSAPAGSTTCGRSSAEARGHELTEVGPRRRAHLRACVTA